MPSTHKKVIVRKMDRDTVSGYVAPAQFVHEGKLELLNTSGTVITMDLREIKGVYFVREFGDSESLTRKTFTSRPRSEGLWVRLRFKDSEILEGLMPADLTQTTPALQHPAHLCATHRAGVADRAGSDRSHAPPTPRRRRSTAGHVVREVTSKHAFCIDFFPKRNEPRWGCSQNGARPQINLAPTFQGVPFAPLRSA